MATKEEKAIYTATTVAKLASSIVGGSLFLAGHGGISTFRRPIYGYGLMVLGTLIWTDGVSMAQDYYWIKNIELWGKKPA